MSHNAIDNSARTTADGTEKQVYPGTTTFCRPDKLCRARRIRLRAAFPDETNHTCFTPKYSRNSASSRCVVACGRRRPTNPHTTSRQLIGAADGASVRCTFMAGASQCEAREHL